MMYFFFFSSRRRHTRYWRDWSSDVCSSDLPALEDVEGQLHVALLGRQRAFQDLPVRVPYRFRQVVRILPGHRSFPFPRIPARARRPPAGVYRSPTSGSPELAPDRGQNLRRVAPAYKRGPVLAQAVTDRNLLECE